MQITRFALIRTNYLQDGDREDKNIQQKGVNLNNVDGRVFIHGKP